MTEIADYIIAALLILPIAVAILTIWSAMDDLKQNDEHYGGK